MDLERLSGHQDDRFEKLFATRKELTLESGARVQAVDLPEKEGGAKAPLVLSGAWGMNPDVYKYVLRDLNASGRRVLAFPYPRQEGQVGTDPTLGAGLERVPNDAMRDALSLLQILERSSIEHAGVLGHSKGGASAILAAVLSSRLSKRDGVPRRIDNLVLFSPAGVIGEDSLSRVAYGFATQRSNFGKQSESFKALPVTDAERTAAAAEGRTIPEYGPIGTTPEDAEGGKAAGASLASHIKQSDVGNTIEQIWGLSRVQLDHLLAELRADGVGITVMAGVDDPVFPIQRMAGTMDETTREIRPGTLDASMVDGFLSIRAEHGIPVPYAPLIEQQFDLLEKKQRARADTSGE